MWSFLKKNKNYAGIDISSNAIKVVELSRNNNALVLENYCLLRERPESVVDKEGKYTTLFTELVQQAIKSCKVKTKLGALAIPNSQVISKKIVVDARLSAKDLEAAMAVETTRCVSCPLAQVSYDYDLTDEILNDASKREVLLIAARKQHVDKRVNMFEQSNLSIAVVDVECYAIERSIKYLLNFISGYSLKNTVAVFNLDATTSKLTVLNDSHVIYHREESFGRKLLTEQGVLLTEIKRELQFFESSLSRTHIDLVILAGDSASMSNLASMLEQQIAIHTILANPFAGITIANSIDQKKLAQDAHALLIACGLALRGFV